MTSRETGSLSRRTAL